MAAVQPQGEGCGTNCGINRALPAFVLKRRQLFPLPQNHLLVSDEQCKSLDQVEAPGTFEEEATVASIVWYNISSQLAKDATRSIRKIHQPIIRNCQIQIICSIRQTTGGSPLTLLVWMRVRSGEKLMRQCKNWRVKFLDFLLSSIILLIIKLLRISHLFRINLSYYRTNLLL